MLTNCSSVQKAFKDQEKCSKSVDRKVWNKQTKSQKFSFTEKNIFTEYSRDKYVQKALKKNSKTV